MSSATHCSSVPVLFPIHKKPDFLLKNEHLETLWEFRASLVIPKTLVPSVRAVTSGLSLIYCRLQFKYPSLSGLDRDSKLVELQNDFRDYIGRFTGFEMLNKFSDFIFLDDSGKVLKNTFDRVLGGFLLNYLDLEINLKSRVYLTVLQNLNSPQIPYFHPQQKAGLDNLILLPYFADFFNIGLVILNFVNVLGNSNGELHSTANYFPDSFLNADNNSTIYFLVQRIRDDGTWCFSPVFQCKRSDYPSCSFFDVVYQRRRKSSVLDDFGYFRGRKFFTPTQQRRFLVKIGLVIPVLARPSADVYQVNRFSQLDHVLYRISTQIPAVAEQFRADNLDFQAFSFFVMTNPSGSEYSGYILPPISAFYTSLTDSRNPMVFSKMYVLFEVSPGLLRIMVKPSAYFHCGRTHYSDWSSFQLNFTEADPCLVGLPWQIMCDCSPGCRTVLVIQNDRFLLTYLCDLRENSYSYSASAARVGWIEQNLPLLNTQLRQLEESIVMKGVVSTLHPVLEGEMQVDDLLIFKNLLFASISNHDFFHQLLASRISVIFSTCFTKPFTIPVLTFPDNFVVVPELVTFLSSYLCIPVCYLPTERFPILTEIQPLMLLLVSQHDHLETLDYYFPSKPSLEIYEKVDWNTLTDFCFKSIVSGLSDGSFYISQLFGRKKQPSWESDDCSIFRKLEGLTNLDSILQESSFKKFSDSVHRYGLNMVQIKLLIAALSLEFTVDRLISRLLPDITSSDEVRMIATFIKKNLI